MNSVAVRYFGHSCFEVTSQEGVRLLIDPHITGNPASPLGLEELDPPDLILVTHAAPDHLGDTLEIVRQSGCRVFCDPAVDYYLKSRKIPPVQVQRMVWGFHVPFRGIRIRAVESRHHSTLRWDGPPVTGIPLGFMITLESGQTLYHAGDTSIFGDLRLFGEIYRPEVAFLPVGNYPGSHAELSPEEAALAAAWLGVKWAIPMHYEKGSDAPYRFVNQVAHKAPGVQVVLIEPGEQVMIGSDLKQHEVRIAR
ncbi:MAG: metal-dependent hydrolase [Nitrospirae bacterium]|nr:metal-dependent hydrolase [Nitrospirota bacterium]